MSARTSRIYAYEWRSWRNFLLPTIAPAAIPIRARLGESWQEVLAQVPDDCGCFIFHVNLTDTARVPFDRADLCQALEARGVKLFNARATSIAKRTIQQICRRIGLPSATAARDGDPHEMLVAKTDRNAFGTTEKAMTPDEAAYLGIHRGGTLRRYIRLPRHAVPDFLWEAQDVVIETWVENPNESFYRAYMMGTKLIIIEVVEPCAFKRLDHKVRRTQ